MTTDADLIASGLLPASWTAAVGTPVSATGGGLDAAVTATAGIVAAVLGCWVLLALGFALAQRATAGRPLATAVLDRCLALVAPGTAGRVLRAAVGLGATGAGLLGPLLATATAEAASPGRPTTRHDLVVVGGGPTKTATTSATTTAPATATTSATTSVHDHGVPPGHPDSGTAAPDPVPDARRDGSLTLWPMSRPGRGESNTGLAAGRQDVVVLRGDSLWAIAARLLPNGSADTAIDAAWRELYAANRAVVGADPNLLLPGQILRVPS